MKMRAALLAAPLISFFCALAPASVRAMSLEREFTFDPTSFSVRAQGTESVVEVKGAYPETRAGYPELPWRGERLELPDGERIAGVEVLSIETAPLADHVHLASALRPSPGAFTNERSAPDVALYSHAGFQPEQPVEIGLQGYEAGTVVAWLRLWPVRWDAASGRLERIVRVRVRLTLESDPSRPLKRERAASGWLDAARPGTLSGAALPDAASRLRAQPFQATQLPSLLGSPVEYVIITGDAEATQMQRLADWKTQCGIPAVVRTLSFIQQNYPAANDDADRMRQFIRDAYQRWGTQYVLLAGDTDVLPTRYGFSTYYYGGSLIATDLYFQCLDGNWNADGDSLYGEGWRDASHQGDFADLMPEVWLGRAPVSTAAQAQQFVDKTLQYEKTPLGDYENSIFFFSEVLFPQNWIPGTTTFLDGATLAESVLPLVDLLPDFHYARLYENYTNPAWRPGALQELKHVVVDSLNRGYNLAVHIGHGYRDVMSCGDDNLSNNDALGLTNGNHLFNLYAIDCTSNAIDFPCIGEAFLHAPLGGAVTNIGSTRVDYPNTGQFFQQDYFTLLFRDSVTTIGETFARQKFEFLPACDTDNVDRWTEMTLALLGDPQLRIWTNLPRTLTVTAPAAIALTDSQLTVTVALGGAPFAGAQVTLYRPNDDFRSALTDASGSLTLPFRPDSLGALLLTVTGHNCRPVQLSINITASATKPSLTEQAPVIDDGAAPGTSGNLNGLLDAGETVDVRVPLRNVGGVTAPAGSASLATSDPLVNVITNSALYGAIAPGAVATPAAAFRINVPYTTPDQREIPFTLTVLDGAGGHTTQTFRLVVRGPDLVSFSHVVLDVGGNGNGRPDPGETVSEFIRLRNVGTGTASTVSLVLRPLDALSAVSDSIAAFGDIAPGQEKQGDAVVFVPNSPDARFEMRIFDRYGLLGTQVLDLSYPGLPISMLAAGSGSSVQLTWAHNNEPDLLGYDIYQATAPAGPYTRVNPTPSDRVAYYQVANAHALTTYYFKVSAVDSSGNESAASSAIGVVTNPPNHTIFPMSMGSVTPSSVVVDHFDEGYPMDVAVGAGVLYVWHSDGSALLDADGQGTTYGDFTTRGKYYAAGPAIGDLDGDGVRELVAATWDSAQVYVFDTQGQVKPGWPRSTGAAWSSPTLADLNNDGKREVMLGNNSNLFYVFRADGSDWVDGDANPATIGVFKVLPYGFNPGTAAVAPLENNGVTDIVFGDEGGDLYAWHPDGSNVPGFPVLIGPSLRASAAVGHLDGATDSQLEIVIPAMNDSLYVIESNGARRAGFPVHVPTSGNSRPPSPALADMNRDGFLDIVQPGTDGVIYVFDRNGATVAPVNGARYSSMTAGAAETSPVVADINGDGWPDVVMGSEDATLTAFSGATGLMLPGFPIPLSGELRGTPALCDCDGDGKTEIVLADWGGTVYMWDYDLPFSPGARPPWPQFHHDAQHTGYFDAPMWVDAPPEGASPPARVEFASPAPNPSRASTRISWAVPAGRSGAPLDIAVFDIGGRRVRTLVHESARSGRFGVTWDLRAEDGSRVSAGLFFVRFALGREGHTHKLAVLR